MRLRSLALLVLLCSFGCSDGSPELESISGTKVVMGEVLRRSSVSGSWPGLGSGLTLVDESGGGQFELLTVADNGAALESDRASINPFFARIVSDGEKSATLNEVIPLKLSAGEVDLEGAALAPDGSVWLADEQIPSLLRIDVESGEVLEWLRPEAGLPLELTRVTPNRGFEGVAVTPGGDLLAVVQSPLRVIDAEDQVEPFARIVRVLGDGRVNVYAYEISRERFASPADIRLSGIVCITDSICLVLERGATAKGGYSNRVYRVNFSAASNIAGEHYSFELLTRSERLFGEDGLVGFPVEKDLVIDLREHDWSFEKSEGLALSADGRRLFIVNDTESERNDGSEDLNLMVYTFDRSLIPFWRHQWVIWLYWLLPCAFVLVALIGWILVGRRRSDGSKVA